MSKELFQFFQFQLN